MYLKLIKMSKNPINKPKRKYLDKNNLRCGLVNNPNKIAIVKNIIEYLFKNVREYVPEEYQDILCPAPSPETNENQPPSKKSRQR